MHLQVFDYNDRRINAIEYNGEPAFIARDVGRALETANDGKSFINSIAEWKEQGEIRDGEHAFLISGDDLRPFAVTGTVTAKTRTLLLLTERGLYRTLLLAGGPKAMKFRDWLDGEVLPALRKTGTYTIPEAAAAVAPEAEDARARSFAEAREIRLLASQAMEAGLRPQARALVLQAIAALPFRIDAPDVRTIPAPVGDIETFVKECLRKAVGEHLSNSEVYRVYTQWASRFDQSPMTHKALTQALYRLGHKQGRGHGSMSRWLDLRVFDEWETVIEAGYAGGMIDLDHALHDALHVPASADNLSRLKRVVQVLGYRRVVRPPEPDDQFDMDPPSEWVRPRSD